MLGKTRRELGYWYEDFVEWSGISEIQLINNDEDTYNLHVKDNHNYFANGVMVSNCHTQKSGIASSVMERFILTKYRIGTTGTIDDAKINALVLQGLMGPIYKVISTKELMDNGQVSQLDINCTVLQYPEHIRKAYKGMTYQEEIAFLVAYEPRNRFIAKLASVVKGNTLVLFNFVDRHGAIIEKMIREITDRKVYFIHGGVDVEERERIRNILSTETDAIVVANSALMSTGVNIPSIRNIIFAIPSKSTIRIRQSIGRGLRLNKGKEKCVLYDIADDLSWKSFKNTTQNHLEDRISIYEKESFSWTLRKLTIT
jgi:superfamily II DNA or RNA helicase